MQLFSCRAVGIRMPAINSWTLRIFMRIGVNVSLECLLYSRHRAMCSTWLHFILVRSRFPRSQETVQEHGSWRRVFAPEPASLRTLLPVTQCLHSGAHHCPQSGDSPGSHWSFIHLNTAVAWLLPSFLRLYLPAGKRVVAGLT